MAKNQQGSKNNHRNKQKQPPRKKKNHHHSSKSSSSSSSSSSSFKRSRHDKLEITFDPVKRREYLTSRSSVKKQGRAFGLAMQKVKDRKAKLEEKRERREIEEERLREQENCKNMSMNMNMNMNLGVDHGGESDEVGESGSKQEKEVVTTFHQDQATQSQFGGQVIVTTTHILSDDEDESGNGNGNHRDLNDGNDDESNSKAKTRTITKKIDMEQRYAGSVQKYMAQFNNGRNLPSKKSKMRDQRNTRGKGKHGAEGMKGMGTAKDLKVAKKTLDRMRDKQARMGGGGKMKGGRQRKSR